MKNVLLKRSGCELTDFCILTYETCYCEIVLDLFHCFEFLEVKHLFFTLLSELAREVWECKELPNYFTLGP